MAIAALKIRVMPDSIEANLNAILKESEEKINEVGNNAKLHSHEIQPIAFGLKALILTLAWPEEKEQELIESKLREISNVQSVEVIDFRRSIG